MQVDSSQGCLQRSQNLPNAIRMPVWPSVVLMQDGIIHNGEGLCSPTSQSFLSIELTAGNGSGDDVESNMFQPR